MAQKLPKTKDLRALPDPEIRTELERLRQELWQSRLKMKDGSLQQSHHMPLVKRQIARIHTVLRERTQPTTGQGTSS